MTPADLLSVPEAARVLGLTPKRVREFCAEGRLGRRLGRWAYVITREELAAFRRLKRPRGRPPHHP